MFKGETKIFEEEGLSEFIGLINFSDNSPVMMMMDGVRSEKFKGPVPVGIFN